MGWLPNREDGFVELFHQHPNAPSVHQISSSRFETLPH
jgi:hypothetical protein